MRAHHKLPYTWLSLHGRVSNGEAVASNTTIGSVNNVCIWISLFGNDIAKLMSDGTVHFTLAGYNTMTTRYRINEILADNNIDASVYAKGNVAHFANKLGYAEIKDNAWYRVTPAGVIDQLPERG